MVQIKGLQLEHIVICEFTLQCFSKIGVDICITQTKKHQMNYC